MNNLSECKVSIYLGDTSHPIYDNDKKLNEVEIKALSICKSVYCNNRYFDITSMAFNFEDNILEVFIK